MMLGIGDSTITVSSDPLAAFNAANPTGTSATCTPGWDANCPLQALPNSPTLPVDYSGGTSQTTVSSCLTAGGTLDPTTGACSMPTSTMTYVLLAVAGIVVIALFSGGHGG